MKKTKAEIDAELKLLRELHSVARKYKQHRIAAAIHVLVHSMSEEAVDAYFGDVFAQTARYAVAWREGHEERPPSEELR